MDGVWQRVLLRGIERVIPILTSSMQVAVGASSSKVLILSRLMKLKAFTYLRRKQTEKSGQANVFSFHWSGDCGHRIPAKMSQNTRRSHLTPEAEILLLCCPGVLAVMLLPPLAANPHWIVPRKTRGMLERIVDRPLVPCGIRNDGQRRDMALSCSCLLLKGCDGTNKMTCRGHAADVMV